MGVNLKALDRKIEKLQRLRKLVAECENDPELAAMLAEIVTPNGNNGKIHSAPKPAPDADYKPNGLDRPRGSFVGAVMGAVAEQHGEFTSNDVEQTLRSKGFEIRAANVNIAINDALGTLKKRGYIDRSGKRGVAVLWKKTISAVESRTA